MTRDERTVLIATAGLVLTAVGALLPWARIGGRNRSGLATADTFIALGNASLPDIVTWVGRWWYLPAVLALVAWATTFASSHWASRSAGIASIVIRLAMWWIFVWAGGRYDVLSTRLSGPILATVGMMVIGYSCSRPRASLLRRP